MAFWGRVLLGVVVRITVSVSIVLAGMALYHAFATWQEDNYFAPPGSMIDVDGHFIHLHCFGGRSPHGDGGDEGDDDDGEGGDATREPTVVFDHATMHLSQQFHKVVGALAATNRAIRVCLVDRAGYGFSEEAPESDDSSSSAEPRGRTAEASAEELFKALHRAGEEPPFVLVGHSSGGVNQLVYAARHGPAAAAAGNTTQEVEVAGLVLVDPMPPGFRLPARLQEMKRTVAAGLRLVPWLARLGLLRNFYYLSSLTGQADAVYAADDLHYRRWAECKPAYWRAVLREFEAEDENRAIERHEADIVAQRWSLPLVVAAAGRLAPSFDDAALREAWMAGMQRLANYSTGGRLVIADKSGHEVPSEQPDLVAQAIVSVLDQWRATTTTTTPPAPNTPASQAGM